MVPRAAAIERSVASSGCRHLQIEICFGCSICLCLAWKAHKLALVRNRLGKERAFKNERAFVGAAAAQKGASARSCAAAAAAARKTSTTKKNRGHFQKQRAGKQQHTVKQSIQNHRKQQQQDNGQIVLAVGAHSRVLVQQHKNQTKQNKAKPKPQPTLKHLTRPPPRPCSRL